MFYLIVADIRAEGAGVKNALLVKSILKILIKQVTDQSLSFIDNDSPA